MQKKKFVDDNNYLITGKLFSTLMEYNNDKAHC